MTSALVGFMESSINSPLLRQIRDMPEDVLVGPELLLEDTIRRRAASLRLVKQDRTVLVCILDFGD